MRENAPRAVTAIGAALQEQIEHGLLQPGAKLPAERTLSELFATTRITLREALLQLEARGLVYREDRRGWFVSPPRLTYDLNERSHFHAMAQRHGRLPATELITARAQAAPAAICDYLGLAPLSAVYRICRARRIDGRLVLYVEHYLNPACFPGLLGHDLSQPLTELYAREYGIEYGQVEFELLPTALPSDAALALKVSTGSPGLRITRINHDRQGRRIDCDLEYWRHDAIRVVATV
ncbi:UTRA domain-containing protein [Pseudomonas japonica]|uniref:UTRA domain-containing protein n=1 Tax=Pseudomonas japonica TaxID=256466 RepID=UPI0015E2B63E|nr:UTRA domain-containing protein [Pseudomonas japonica]MBA1241901.1 UTRA domain-containing protein [Pseudomonas japonica]MBA1288838.1 UTRA domain-containing protein [Pseudomonas japonica]